MCDAAVVREGGEIEQLSDTPGAQAEEPTERVYIVHIDDAADIPFHVRLFVALHPQTAVHFLCMKLWVHPAPEKFFECYSGLEDDGRAWTRESEWIACVPSPELCEAQGQQVEHGHTPGERLADVLQKEEVLGAGEDEPAGLSVSVHDGLEGGEQFRHALCLVEDDPAPEAGEESLRILHREFPLCDIFERYVVMSGKCCSHERRLPRLPRSHDEDDGKVPCGTFQGGGEVSCKHAPSIRLEVGSVKLNIKSSIGHSHALSSVRERAASPRPNRRMLSSAAPRRAHFSSEGSPALLRRLRHINHLYFILKSHCLKHVLKDLLRRLQMFTG